MWADREREESSASAYTSSVANSIYGHSYGGRLRMRQLLRLREANRRASVPADAKLAQRRPLYLIAALLLLAGLLIQYPLLLFCGLLILGITIVPELWYRYGLRGLVATREMESQRAAFGSVATVALTLENSKLLPLPMVETEDEFPEALTVLGARLGLAAKPESAWLTRGLRLWAFQRVRRRYYVRAIQRGAYSFGPTVVRVTDPFGILTRQESFETNRTLLTHPLIAPLERFDLSPRAIFGDHASRARLLEDPLRVAGVRDYIPGDDPRRVHWKATARLGALQSKLLDPSTQRTLIIALDVRTFIRAQMGYDPELAELGVSVAASVAAWAMEHGYAVGLISNGAFSTVAVDGQAPSTSASLAAARTLPRLRLAPAARPEQLTLILDSLARLALYGGAPIAPLLTEEMRSAPTGATLVYVGLESLVGAQTIVALRRAQAAGHAVMLALTTRDDGDPFDEDASKHDLHTSALPTFYVGGRTRWKALVAEALGDLPPRMATDVPSEEHLAMERRLIAKQREARVNWRQRRKDEETHAESEERRNDDSPHPDEPTHAALALS